MTFKPSILCTALLCVASFSCASVAGATVVTINGTDSIYNYNGIVAGTGSTQPTTTAITAGAGQVLTFSSVTGLVNLTQSGPYNHGPDGGPSSPPGANPVTVSAAAGLSGSTASESASLFGVFLNGNESALHVTPATLVYASPSDYTFSSASPLIDQVFFIGDGLTGTGTGSQQIFNVPTDATGLVLGIVDAGGYFGPPGAYFDNSGSFTATFGIASAVVPPSSDVPEPSTWAMLLLGACAIVARARRSQLDALRPA